MICGFTNFHVKGSYKTLFAIITLFFSYILYSGMLLLDGF